MGRRSILIVGGGTAGWLTAANLARALAAGEGGALSITLVESPEVGTIGVGEGTFPTIRNTLRYLGIDETRFVREASATFKQGIRFLDWAHAPEAGARHQFFHPFEPPFHDEAASLVPYWLLLDEGSRPPFAQAMTIQHRVAQAGRAPKRPHEGDYAAPLNYAYHVDAGRLSVLLADRARELGVRHVQDLVTGVELGEDGMIAGVATATQGRLEADLYVDCSGFRAELIGRLGVPFRSVRPILFADRALACKTPYDRPDAPLESATLATAHEGGWIWDIGLSAGRGIGCVYSSDHVDDDRAARILADYVGAAGANLEPRLIAFDAGYRERQWVGNCVAVGLAGGFLEPLEATGIVLIETAAAMIAELLPSGGAMDGAARRFNALMSARFERMVDFLKLHYCLGRRQEPFWRDNRAPESIPERLRELLQEWRHRPPSRFDFLLDLDTFAFFNYQYILSGMGYRTDLSAAGADFPSRAAAERRFERIRHFGERAAEDLPPHRALIEQIHAADDPLLA